MSDATFDAWITVFDAESDNAAADQIIEHMAGSGIAVFLFKKDTLSNKRMSDLEAWQESLVTMANIQAEDDGLWFMAVTAPEGYLQQELRKLHAAIEERL